MKHVAIVQKNGHFPLEIKEYDNPNEAKNANPDCEIMSAEFYRGYKLAMDRVHAAQVALEAGAPKKRWWSFWRKT